MRGRQTSPEKVYAVMLSYAVTNNCSETARKLGMSSRTVIKIVNDNKDNPEFAEICEKKKKEFAEKASEIISKGMELLDRRFDRALCKEEELDALIAEIFATSREELTQDEKNKLINKIHSMQLHDVRAITTAIGTLYDKRALAEGAATSNVNLINSESIDKLAELAGYKKA